MTARARAYRLAWWQSAVVCCALGLWALIGVGQVTAPRPDLAQARVLTGEVRTSEFRDGGSSGNHRVEFTLAGEPLWLRTSSHDEARRLHGELLWRRVEAKVISERTGAVTRQTVLELRRDGEVLHSFQDALAVRDNAHAQGWIFLATSSMLGLWIVWSALGARRAMRELEEVYNEGEAALGPEAMAALVAEQQALEEGLFQVAELDRKLSEQRLAHGAVAAFCLLLGLPALGAGVLLLASLQLKPMLGSLPILGVGLAFSYGASRSWAGRHNPELAQQRDALHAQLTASVEAFDEDPAGR